MSLVAGRGPLSADPAGRFAPPIPSDVVYIEPHPRRVQAVLDGRVVIDTEQVLMVHRQGHPLSYLFRAEEVDDLPAEPEPEAPGFVHVPWDAVDTWLEEGRELVHYPPNPYHRVDCRPTKRRLRVSVAGTALVDTDDTVIVFETALQRPALRRPGAGAHRSAALLADVELLQLQGFRDVLVGGSGRYGRRRHRVELRRSAAGKPSDQRLPEFRCHPGGCGCGAAKPVTLRNCTWRRIPRVTPSVVTVSRQGATRRS